MEDRDDVNNGKTLVTVELLSRWENAAEKGSIKAIRKLILAFRIGSHLGDTTELEEDKDKSNKLPFSITSSEVFNELMLLCFKRMAEFFNNKLEYASPTIEGKNLAIGNITLPDTCGGWGALKKLVRFFLLNVLHFLEHMTDPQVVLFILRETKHLVPYISAMPKIRTTFLKRFVEVWSTGNEAERVHAFMVIYRLAVMSPYPFIDAVLKSTTLAYVNTCKFTSIQTLPTIRFMQNSVVELYGLDFTASYQHAFIYIRQLAIHLRNALSTHRKREGTEEVYNWVFINSMYLWARLLISYPGQQDLSHLIYPLTQLLFGVANLVPTPRWYPLRFHCIRMLNLLGKKCSTFICTAPLLLDVLNHSDFSKKRKSTTLKPVDFSCCLKVSKSLLQTGVYMDGVFEQTHQLLTENMAIYSSSASFPEMVVPIVVALKQFRRRCKIASYTKLVSSLLKKIHESAESIQNERSSSEISLEQAMSRIDFFSVDTKKGGLHTSDDIVQKKQEPINIKSSPEKKKRKRKNINKKQQRIKRDKSSAPKQTNPDKDTVEDFILSSEE